MIGHSLEEFLTHGHSHRHDGQPMHFEEDRLGPFDERPVPVIGQNIDRNGLWQHAEASCARRRSSRPGSTDHATNDIASVLEAAGFPVSIAECEVKIPFENGQFDGKWRSHRFPVTNIVPDGGAPYFVLVGGKGDASLLELARLFRLHRNELRHGIRFAWWGSDDFLGFEPAAWYSDANFDLLRSRCLAYMSVEQLADNSLSWDKTCATADFADWASFILARVAGKEVKPTDLLEGADGSFLSVGLPSFSFFPITNAVTLDEMDPNQLVERTAFHADALYDLCTSPRAPFRMMSVAEAFWGELLRIYEEVGAIFNFGEIREAIKEFVVVLDDRLAKDAMLQPLEANRKWMDICHLINPILYTENGPFGRDVGGNRGRLPGLRRALTLKEMDPGSAGEKRLLRELLQESNRICSTISQAILVARRDD